MHPAALADSHSGDVSRGIGRWEVQPLNHSDSLDLSDADIPTGFASDAGLLSLCTEELELKTALLESLAGGILAHTLDGRILYFNPALTNMLGFTAAEFANLEPWGWVGPAMRDTIPERMNQLRRGEMCCESQAVNRDGSLRHTEVHSRIVDLPLDGEILVSVIHDITERIAAHEDIRHLAFHDTLTGLANRVLLDERMSHAIASAERHGDVVGVVFLDLDDFKPVNDTLGHSTGDIVLRVVADRLSACVREYDTVARLGGDEFFVLFTRLSANADLANLAQKLAECVGEPMDIDGNCVRVSASVGLAVHRPGDATDELMTRADHAMYRAKRNGLLGWEEFLTEG